MLKVKDYYDDETGTFSYLVSDSESGQCIVIDPVLKYDIVSGHISDKCIRPLIADIESDNLELHWVLETHAHADHLTAAQQLKAQFGANIGIGRGIVDIQKHFKSVYGFDDSFDTTGQAFDVLFEEGDTISIGQYTIKVLATPGHTRDSISYHLENYLFIGDTLFHPTIGSARCDFPGGDADLLFSTIERILSFPDDTILCLCHDYPGSDREAEPFISVERMRSNAHIINSDNSRANFIALRHDRDASLKLPKLIIPAIQVNTQAGLTEAQAKQSLVWPINRF